MSAVDANAAVRACFFVEASSSTCFPGFHKRSWSLDACVGYALAEGSGRVYKTLYNYVDLGLMDIKNIDLPEKVKRTSGSCKQAYSRPKHR